MLYSVYERGEQDGRIVQATKTYGQPDYGKMLADHAMPYVAKDHPTLISDAEWYVGTTNEELRERPIMPIEIERNIIKAGVNDACIARGIPRQASITVTMRDGTIIYPTSKYDSEELEISIPIPCTYRVVIDYWPYRTFTYEIEAIA